MVKLLKGYSHHLPSTCPRVSLASAIPTMSVTLTQGGSPLNFDPFFYLWCMSQGKMTASGNSLRDSFPFNFFLELISPRTILLREKLIDHKLHFCWAQPKSPSLLSRSYSDCLANGHISIWTRFAGPERLDVNALHSVLILLIFSKTETTSRSHITMKGGGFHQHVYSVFHCSQLCSQDNVLLFDALVRCLGHSSQTVACCKGLWVLICSRQGFLGPRKE